MSQNHSRKMYKVTSLGPINIGGVLRRKDDIVSLSDAEAVSYAGHVSKRPVKPETKSPEATKPETKVQDKNK